MARALIEETLPLWRCPSVEAIDPPPSAKRQRLTRQGGQIIEVSCILINVLVICYAKSDVSYFLFSYRRLSSDDNEGATDDSAVGQSAEDSPPPWSSPRRREDEGAIRDISSPHRSLKAYTKVGSHQGSLQPREDVTFVEAREKTVKAGSASDTTNAGP